MSQSSIAPRLVFGFRGDVADNVAYADDGSVVYPAGHNIVLFSPDTRAQRLIPGTIESEGITAMCVSPGRKLLAVAEKAEKAMITVYDLQTLKRRKVLLSSDAGSKEYVSMSFSQDGKMLLAQGGAPEYNMVLWVWEKSKVTAVAKTTNQQGSAIFNCALSPSDDNALVSVVGQGIFKMFKLVDGSFKLLNVALGKKDAHSIISQQWVGGGSDGDSKERLLLGTSDGEIVMLEGTDARSSFSCENGLPVESILTYSKGFVVGQDEGLVTIFEKDEKEIYRRARAFTIENNPAKVKYLTVSPNEESLVCSLDNNQMYSLLLSNNEIMKVDEMNFDVLGSNNHQGPITGLDICVRKPLLATCSTDKTVRLWNYNDRTCELTKTFSDEIYSIAIHPTGLQVLVGMSDKLRLMTVLMEDLKIVKELGIKGCRECCFSTGGQYFAAVNGTTISIYNTYTCENVGNLRGHNGKVRSLSWAPDDTKLISAGMDGAVYEWRLKDLKREKENVLKGCNYSSVLSTPDCKTLYAAGSDKKIKEFEEAPGAGTQITKEIDAGTNLTQICLLPNAKLMFAATEMGCLRTYKFPLTGEFQEVKCHQQQINRLKMTWDEQLLCTASDDGSIFIYDVRDKDAKAAARREQERVDFSIEVLVTRSDLEERKTRMQDLEQQVAELTMQTEYQLRLKDLHLQEKIKELNEKYSAELEADRHKFELLLSEKNEQEMEYEEKLKTAEERAQAQLSALDTQYQAKIMAEVERFQQLTQEKEQLNERWDEQNSLLVESHERVIAELTEDYESKLAEEALKMEVRQSDKSELEREFEEIKRQLEEDADREIEEMKEKYDGKLTGEREASLRLKGENGIMRKKFNALQKDIEAQKEEIKNLFEQKRELYATIASLEKDISSLKREIRERDETIGDKERRIYDLKKKNQELEKFKFVLDYKIKELKKQIEPREIEIAEMKEQIKEMDGELERYHKTNSGLELLISNMKLKQNGLQAEVLTQRTGKSDASQQLQCMQHDLQKVMPYIQEHKVFKEKVKALYHRYCGESVASVEPDADLEREAARQREYLEKTVDSLKRKLAKDSELHRTDNLRIMQENTALIKEVNELRREMKALRNRLAGGGAPSAATAPARSQMNATGDLSDGLRRELEMQRELIGRMREEGGQKDAKIRHFESMVAPRPMSRERLPPMEGFTQSATVSQPLVASGSFSRVLSKPSSPPNDPAASGEVNGFDGFDGPSDNGPGFEDMAPLGSQPSGLGGLGVEATSSELQPGMASAEDASEDEGLPEPVPPADGVADPVAEGVAESAADTMAEAPAADAAGAEASGAPAKAAEVAGEVSAGGQAEAAAEESDAPAGAGAHEASTSDVAEEAGGEAGISSSGLDAGAAAGAPAEGTAGEKVSADVEVEESAPGESEESKDQGPTDAEQDAPQEA